jgi:hypothetical protein
VSSTYFSVPHTRMSTPRTNPRWWLFPGCTLHHIPLPNHIGLAIIGHLPFEVLIRTRMVSVLWQHAVDTSDDLCLKLFILPKRLRDANSVDREAYLDLKWEALYDGFQHSPSHDELWGGIKRNPLLTNENEYVYDGGAHGLNPLECIKPLISKIPRAQRKATKLFLHSMFVTYPPIYRTQLFAQFKHHHSSDDPPASRILVDFSGITLGKIVESMGNPRRAARDWAGHALLWPEEAWSAYTERQYTGRYPRSWEVVYM